MASVVSVWRAEEKEVFFAADQSNRKMKDWTAGKEYKKIGDGVFKNNTRLRQVTLPANIENIGIQSFYNTRIQRADILGAQVIGREAFCSCAKLESIRLPETVTHIGRRAFAQCRRMESAELEAASICGRIKEETFAECASLKSIVLPKGLRYIEKRAFYKCTSLEDIVLPEALRAIGTEAFYQTALKEVKLPQKLERIGDSAFLKCNQLRYVKIPESVKAIEKWAFHGCNRLQVLEILHEPEEIGAWIINKSAVIRCRKGSSVEKYCIDSGFRTELVP